ncbi:MAG: hypothetical protein ACREUC_20580, partial [Steroidobacteraceae bacterium]
MSASQFFRSSLVTCCLLVAWPFAEVDAQTGDAKPAAAQPRDGQHDFDWEIGTWKTKLQRRLRPLTGSNEWVEYEGTSVVS